jgi:hypothetical protein
MTTAAAHHIYQKPDDTRLDRCVLPVAANASASQFARLLMLEALIHAPRSVE